MSSSSSTALTKRQSENALMPPPPPPKRIKRPPKIIDEEDYTAALSNIIARDFFPGLQETKAQQEYMSALEANDEEWIRTAGRKLTAAMTPQPGKRRARATRLGSSLTPHPDATPRFAGDTPRGWGGATPSVAGTEISQAESESSPSIDTSTMSLSEFQSKYTSEDNESFNALLDKQNEKKREKYAFLWNDNKILAPRQLLHRAREQKLLTQSSDADKALIPITTGATSDRPAQPTAWKHSQPDNTFMFNASGVEDTHETIAQKAEAASRAPPRQTLYSNTRFRPPSPQPSPSIPPSPSMSAVRDAIAGRPRLSTSEIGSDVYTGAETPRINGYTFVDEDEPDPDPSSRNANAPSDEPTYRDLLAGQSLSSGPSPFTIAENRKREALHHRLVDKTAREKREKRKETIKTPIPKFPSSPFIGGNGTGTRGNSSRTPLPSSTSSDKPKGLMTPAARKLMERIGGSRGGGGGGGKTPLRLGINATTTHTDGGGPDNTAKRNIWTPSPRRKATSSATGGSEN